MADANAKKGEDKERAARMKLRNSQEHLYKHYDPSTKFCEPFKFENTQKRREENPDRMYRTSMLFEDEEEMKKTWMDGRDEELRAKAGETGQVRERAERGGRER